MPMIGLHRVIETPEPKPQPRGSPLSKAELSSRRSGRNEGDGRLLVRRDSKAQRTQRSCSWTFAPNRTPTHPLARQAEGERTKQAVDISRANVSQSLCVS